MKKAYYFSTRQIITTTALLAIAILAVDRFLGYGFISGGRTDALNPETQALMQTRGAVLMSEADKAVAVAAMATNEATSDSNEIGAPSPAAVDQSASQRGEAWRPAANNAADPAIPLSDRISVYQRVQLDPHPADLPIVGEQVTLPMFNGKKLVADVQSTAVSSNGDYTWRGHITGHGDDYPVVMTYGEHSTFATITTPEGAYTLESVDGLGWLYKNPSFPELSAPGTNDFLEVEHAH